MTAEEFADAADDQGLATFVSKNLKGEKRIRLLSVELENDSRGKSYLDIQFGGDRYTARCYLIEPSPANLQAGDFINFEAQATGVKEDRRWLEFGDAVLLDHAAGSGEK